MAMKSEYQIALHIKSPRGFENYAVFFIGTDGEAAKELFHTFKGSRENVEDAVLVIELRREFRGLPIDIRMIGCTLNEMLENVKAITKHRFNLLNRELTMMG